MQYLMRQDKITNTNKITTVRVRTSGSGLENEQDEKKTPEIILKG
jgi:hypothetical protein